MKRAIFPGSFDPLTHGHVDITRRALNIFDEVLIGILHNPLKNSFFPIEERVELVQEVFKDEKRVLVRSFTGLLVEFAQEMNCNVIVRGLRATSDFDYEAQMALMNRSLHKDLETLFLMSTEPYSYVSSSLVKNIAPFGGSVTRLVPPPVEKALQKRFPPQK